MKYTIESLSKINTRFLSTHYALTQNDVDMANDYVELIRRSRNQNTPVIGDIVRYTDEDGNYYEYAHIDKIYDGMAEVCEHANSYIYDNDCGLGFSTSGGSWHYIDIAKMKYVGMEEKRFWHFGHCGACADGGIDFMAVVNVWECDMNEQPFSTKTHDKYYVWYSEQPNEYGYRFKIHLDGMSYKAYQTVQEFNAWLRTYRGVITKRSEHCLVVWTYKENAHHVSPKGYDQILGIDDVMLMNGSQRMCKRKYDDENKVVHTYYVWYWDDPNVPDIPERLMYQNKIIDTYKCSGLPYQYARHELASGKVEPIFK